VTPLSKAYASGRREHPPLGVANADCDDRHTAGVEEIDEIGADEPVSIVFHRETPRIAGALGGSDAPLGTQPTDEPVALELRQPLTKVELRRPEIANAF
jgi:hypothetical protein